MAVSSSRSRLERVLDWWKAVPLAGVLVLVLLLGLPIWVMLARGEDRAKELYYPASHFPMYSDFTDWEYVVYLADGEGEPLAMERLTGGLRVARMKKQYNSLLNDRLDAIRDELGTAPSKENAPAQLKREVGDEVLAYLVAQWRERRPETLAAQGSLRLYLQPITMERGKVRPGEPQLVGQWPAQATPAPSGRP